MLQYIYFVKCPNCEDEPFDFFNDAKDYALGCLSAKPIITQTEVDRNDFGECTDSRDLGTIWSWEDMMIDVPMDDELTTFSKGETLDFDYDPGQDSEFLSIDNTLDEVPDNFRRPAGLAETYYAVVEVDGEERKFPFDSKDKAKEYLNFVRAGKDPAFKGKTIGSTYTESCRKPIPDGMTVEDLVEEMEENEDDVECKWCGELFDKSEGRYEVDMGWLCDYCIAAIKSRGETLTFREDINPLAEKTILSEGAFDFEYLANQEDPKAQILNLLRQSLSDFYFNGDTLAEVKAVYSKYGYTATVKDFNLSSTGRIDIMYTNDRTGQICIGDLEDVLEGLQRNSAAYKLFQAIKKAAGDLNKRNKPGVSARRDASVFGLLQSNPKVAEEFRNHVKKIEYRIPLLDDPTYADEFGFDKDNAYLSDEAYHKLETIYSNFMSLEFAQAALDAGMVTNRPSYEDYNHNIEKSWAAVGVITFDCHISQLSQEARDIIKIAKVKGVDAQTPAYEGTTSTCCYRLANALVKYFNNDVLFYQHSQEQEALHEATSEFTWDKEPVELEYDKLSVTLQGEMKDSNDPYEPPYCDEWDEVVSHTYEADPVSVAEYIYDLMTEEDIVGVPGGFNALDTDDALFNRFMEEHFYDLVEKYMTQLLAKFEDDAARDYEDNYNPAEARRNAEANYWDDYRDGHYFDESCATEEKQTSMLEELEDSETYRERLTLCPECATTSFDIETGICINCGFN